jgi:glycosyltransferase involved in cell wall biosynthesis
MKILFAFQNCEIGGVPVWMLELSESLNALGHECEMFFFRHGAFEASLPSDCVARFGDLADCLKWVRSRQFDVVHAAVLDWDLGISAVRCLGAKLVLTTHGWIHKAWNSANCDALVGCSKWNALAQQPWSDMPVQVVPYGIDISRFHPPEQISPTHPIVAWVGRGSDLYQKQIDRLAAVAPALCRAGLRLWIADPDGPNKILPSAADTLGPIAEFWSGVIPARMPSFYRAVAASGGCLLSTSRFEGLSIAYIEAQASGCPVIGPDVRGVNEEVDPEHGGVLYAPSIEPDALARLVVDSVGDQPRMRWRRSACRDLVQKRFTVRQMAENYLRIYEDAPYPPRRDLGIQRTQFRAAPFRYCRNYREQRWRAGNNQYLASKRLADREEGVLAAKAAVASLYTCPTLYARPSRLVHLMKAVWGRRRFVGRQ